MVFETGKARVFFYNQSRPSPTLQASKWKEEEMGKIMVSLILVGSFMVVSSRAHADDYPYDRSKSGCVMGDCLSGYGVYVYDNDDVYDGYWKDGKRNGRGIYSFVNGGAWSAAYKLIGPWRDGNQHGEFSYVNPNGARTTLYWYDGKDVTSQVQKCRTASTATEGYKGFVAIVNGLFAAMRGDDIAESAEWGYNAAGEQTVPKIVDLSCEKLLREFE